MNLRKFAQQWPLRNRGSKFWTAGWAGSSKLLECFTLPSVHSDQAFCNTIIIFKWSESMTITSLLI